MKNKNGTGHSDEPSYNMKAVVSKTGLNPATIRAWERRYGFPVPKRTAGGHRQYSQQDIDSLIWLVARQDEGISISHAIDMWRSHQERGEDPTQLDAVAAPEASTRFALTLEGDQIDQLQEAWLEACLDLDRGRAEQILSIAFAQFAPEAVCFGLLQYGLAEIGNGWYRGDYTVQQEHFITAISNQRLETLIAASPPPTRRERVIIFSAPGDLHVFSPLLLTFLLRRQGFDVVYLGADVPVAELESTINSVEPDLAVVTAQLFDTAAGLKDMAQSLQSQGIMLAFGGLAFTQIPSLRPLISGHFLGETLEEAVQAIPELIASKPQAPTVAPPSEVYQKALKQYQGRRALIDSHVWGTFIATNKPTKHLSKVNHDLGQIIESALSFGDLNLLATDIHWIEYLLASYRLSTEWIIEYLEAYQHAATIHLSDAAIMIVNWLAKLLSDESDN